MGRTLKNFLAFTKISRNIYCSIRVLLGHLSDHTKSPHKMSCCYFMLCTKLMKYIHIHIWHFKHCWFWPGQMPIRSDKMSVKHVICYKNAIVHYIDNITKNGCNTNISSYTCNKGVDISIPLYMHTYSIITDIQWYDDIYTYVHKFWCCILIVCFTTIIIVVITM